MFSNFMEIQSTQGNQPLWNIAEYNCVDAISYVMMPVVACQQWQPSYYRATKATYTY